MIINFKSLFMKKRSFIYTILFLMLQTFLLILLNLYYNIDNNTQHILNSIENRTIYIMVDTNHNNTNVKKELNSIREIVNIKDKEVESSIFISYELEISNYKYKNRISKELEKLDYSLYYPESATKKTADSYIDMINIIKIAIGIILGFITVIISICLSSFLHEDKKHIALLKACGYKNIKIAIIYTENIFILTLVTNILANVLSSVALLISYKYLFADQLKALVNSPININSIIVSLISISIIVIIVNIFSFNKLKKNNPIQLFRSN